MLFHHPLRVGLDEIIVNNFINLKVTQKVFTKSQKSTNKNQTKNKILAKYA